MNFSYSSPPNLFKRILGHIRFSKPDIDPRISPGEQGFLRLTGSPTEPYCYEQPSRRTTLLPRILRFAQPIMRRLKIYPTEDAKDNPHDNRFAGLNNDQFNPAEPASPSATSSDVGDGISQEQIQADRAIREEQDKAFELALARDRERMESAREAERLAKEVEDRIRMQAQLKKERKEQEEARRKLQIDWRRWARRALIPDTPDTHSIKIAIRLPSGVRSERRLPSSATLETLHILAETLLIPKDYPICEDPEDPPEGYTHEQEFQLVWTNPNGILPNNKAVLVGDLEILRHGVLLIMESTGSGSEFEYEYDSESDFDSESSQAAL
ncbi:UBX (ubiquitin regulatory X) domain protein [Ceratobasidium sp. AG-Ba]|nr:UBX (ubiquitin regulatory X) domain protein [Ceratobasidium sp. AG-Ba]